ncbi:glutaredoxin-C4 [Capsicum galapagoense]
MFGVASINHPDLRRIGGTPETSQAAIPSCLNPFIHRILWVHTRDVLPEWIHFLLGPCALLPHPGGRICQDHVLSLPRDPTPFPLLAPPDLLLDPPPFSLLTYCKKAKAVFKELKQKPYVVELDERDDGWNIQDAISEIVGRRTVPQVFINGKHIGGSDDTIEAYEKGELAKLLGVNAKNDDL